MPYKTKAQARAVLANTSPRKRSHRHARIEAKKTLRRKKRN